MNVLQGCIPSLQWMCRDDGTSAKYVREDRAAWTAAVRAVPKEQDLPQLAWPMKELPGDEFYPSIVNKLMKKPMEDLLLDDFKQMFVSKEGTLGEIDQQVCLARFPSIWCLVLGVFFW